MAKQPARTAGAKEGAPATGGRIDPRILIPIAILVITFFAYAAVMGFQFVYDDGGQIVENKNIESWSNVPLYFTGHSWSHADEAGGTYYRPLFLVWLLVNRTLFGLAPWGWHLAALALHLACTLGVYLLARRLTDDQMTAAFASLIFGLHPAHVEAVAWVSGATESLMALLVITSFSLYLRAEGEKNGRAYTVASLASYALAMLAKETALVLPILIFAHRWIYRAGAGESPAQKALASFKKSAPYLALTAVYLVARVAALGGLGQTHTDLSVSTILLTWPSLLWFYVKHLIYPVGLSEFYDTPYVTRAGPADFFLPALLVLACAALVWFVSRRSRPMKFAALLMVVPLVPLLNLSVFQEGDIAHDRYLYLPSIGFSLILAIAINRLKGGPELLGRPAAQVAATLALVCLLGTATFAESQNWASNLLLYHRGVTVAPSNSIAKNNLANELVAREMYGEAIELYRQVLEQKPNFWLSNYNLGFSLYKLNRFDDAEPYFKRAIAINSTDPDQYVYLGLSQMKLNRLDEAATNIRRAIEIRPKAPGYHFALASVLKKQGNLAGAIDEFRGELANNPQHPASLKEIADLQSKLGSGN